MEETKINQVKTASDITLVEMLATKIWHEHYPQIIGKEQVDYMLAKYQSFPAIKRQINDGISYYLLYENNHPVGYFSYHFENDALFLSKIYVIKEVRGNGVGKHAMKFINSKAHEQPVNRVKLTVNKYNLESIEFYKSLGFDTVDSVEKEIGGGFIMDDYVMEMSVSESSKQHGVDGVTKPSDDRRSSQNHTSQGQVA